MTKIRMPTCPKSLRGQSLKTKDRVDLKLNECVLLGEFNNWNLDYFIQAYLSMSRVYDPTGHNVYQTILESLRIMSLSHNSFKDI
jgi:hypothetical protein